jgi:putative resolvase
MDEYLSTKEVRKILGVTTQTLINWNKTGKINTIKSPSGARLYNKKDIYNIIGIDKIIEPKKCYCYARVSSKKQMDDLERQKDFFKSRYPNHILVTDIGSGINWKRKGLKTILEQAMSGDVSEIVVAHRDRLCRFAFDIIEWIITYKGCKLIVLHDDTHKSENQELADDIMSIIHVYSCRQMGKRRYKDTIENEESKNLSE